MNQLSIISRVTTTIDDTNYNQVLLDVDVIPLKNIILSDLYHSTKIFLNGRFFGIHFDPKYLYRYLKLLKLNSIINITTSISWNVQMSEFHIFTDSGRIIRPIFHL